jgi:hypothetical protein
MKLNLHFAVPSIEQEDIRRSNKANEKALMKIQKKSMDPTEEATIAKKEKEKQTLGRETTEKGSIEGNRKGEGGGTRQRQEGRAKEEFQNKAIDKESKEAKKICCATGQTKGSNARGWKWLQAPGFEGAGCMRQGVDGSLREGRSVAA